MLLLQTRPPVKLGDCEYLGSWCSMCVVHLCLTIQGSCCHCQCAARPQPSVTLLAYLSAPAARVSPPSPCAPYTQGVAPSVGDEAELEATELLNPFNAVGLLLGSAVAGAVFLQKKQSEVRDAQAVGGNGQAGGQQRQCGCLQHPLLRLLAGGGTCSPNTAAAPSAPKAAAVERRDSTRNVLPGRGTTTPNLTILLLRCCLFCCHPSLPLSTPLAGPPGRVRWMRSWLLSVTRSRRCRRRRLLRALRWRQSRPWWHS